MNFYLALEIASQTCGTLRELIPKRSYSFDYNTTVRRQEMKFLEASVQDYYGGVFLCLRNMLHIKNVYDKVLINKVRGEQ